MFPLMRTTLTHSSQVLPTLTHSMRNHADLTYSRHEQLRCIAQLRVKERIAKEQMQGDKTIADISLISGIGAIGTGDLISRFKDSLSKFHDPVLDVLATLGSSDTVIYGGMGLCAISVVMRCSSLYERIQARAAAKEMQQLIDKINHRV